MCTLSVRWHAQSLSEKLNYRPEDRPKRTVRPRSAIQHDPATRQPLDALQWAGSVRVGLKPCLQHPVLSSCLSLNTDASLQGELSGYVRSASYMSAITISLHAVTWASSIPFVGLFPSPFRPLQAHDLLADALAKLWASSLQMRWLEFLSITQQQKKAWALTTMPIPRRCRHRLYSRKHRTSNPWSCLLFGGCRCI